MQVTETLKKGLKREYSIVVSAGELDAKVNEKLAEAQPEVELKGFRKGKVPLALLKKQFGKRLLGEAMQESIDGAMNQHFDESGERPALQPDVKMSNEDWKEGEDVHVDLKYEALPTIPELEFKTVKLERMVAKADADSIDEALSNLAASSQNFKDRRKGSKAKNGDQVVFDFFGSVGGEEFEGGSAEDYPLVLGSNSFIPGFENQLVGAKAGENLDVNVTFPGDYGAENLAGKDALFKCVVKSVQEPVAAEINDELATKFGSDDLEALKAQVSERLENEYAGAARAITKRGLLDALDKMVDFDLPPSLVEAEAKQIAHQLWHEDNPDVEGHDHEEVEATAEHTALAERRVRLGLLLADIGMRASIEVTDAEMSQAIMQQAQQYPGQERQFFEFVQQNQAMQQQMRAPIFEDKVVNYVFELATITEKTVTKDALQAAVDALEDN